MESLQAFVFAILVVGIIATLYFQNVKKSTNEVDDFFNTGCPECGSEAFEVSKLKDHGCSGTCEVKCRCMDCGHESVATVPKSLLGQSSGSCCGSTCSSKSNTNNEYTNVKM